MYESSEIKLPASGLAEDILAHFSANIDAVSAGDGREPAAAPAQKPYHLVTFRLGREEYGVDIGQVQEIIRATDITAVPGSHPHVRGVINLRGRIIPVIDLRRRFSLPEGEVTEEQRIVVVEFGPKRLGLLVDGVSQVLKIPAALVEEVPDDAGSPEEQYVRGLGKLEERLVIILDLWRMLANPSPPRPQVEAP